MKSWRPYTREFDAEAALPVERAQGAYLHLQGGQKIFDGISSWWLVTFGHSHPRISEAIQRQSARLSQAVFANFSHEPAGRLLELLGEFLPKRWARAFFSDNGSTAVEVAMKMALQARRLQGAPRRRKFLAFSRGYHGDTCGAMSVSSRGPFTAHFHDFLFEILRCEQGLSATAPLERWLGDFERTIETHGDDICAIILEPLVQGAGGMIVWPEGAVEAVCKRARERGIFVIFDEVMTGFGRTGSAFAFQKLPDVCLPDFLCLSKGLTGGFLPMGLTLTTEEIFAVFQERRDTLYHGHSYTGNALSCAAAAANIELWLTHPPDQDLARIERAQKRILSSAPHRRFAIQETRVCGTIGVLELEPSAAFTNPRWPSLFTKRCLQDGVFTRPLGLSVYLLPPYCATDDELETAWQVVFQHLTAMSEMNTA